MSVTQSMQFGKFVSSLEFEKIFSPEAEEDPMTDLFQGSDVDVEDILIHYEGYKPEKVHELFGVDPEYVEVKEKLEELNSRRKQLKGQQATLFNDVTPKE